MLPKKENQDLDLSETTQVHILFSGSLILSEYSFPKPNILDVRFLETGEIESSEDKEEIEVKGSRKLSNLEDMEKKRRKKEMEVKQEESEIVIQN